LSSYPTPLVFAKEARKCWKQRKSIAKRGQSDKKRHFEKVKGNACLRQVKDKKRHCRRARK
jgi:hypothetical protein